MTGDTGPHCTLAQTKSITTNIQHGSPPQFVLFGELLNNKDHDYHNAQVYLYSCT